MNFFRSRNTTYRKAPTNSSQAHNVVPDSISDNESIVASTGVMQACKVRGRTLTAEAGSILDEDIPAAIASMLAPVLSKVTDFEPDMPRFRSENPRVDHKSAEDIESEGNISGLGPEPPLPQRMTDHHGKDAKENCNAWSSQYHEASSPPASPVDGELKPVKEEDSFVPMSPNGSIPLTVSKSFSPMEKDLTLDPQDNPWANC